MRPILLAALVSLMLTLGVTPFAIRLFRSRGFGQLIREDIGHFHGEKRGTPTMGGVLIIAGVLAGYLAAHIVAPFRTTGTAGLLVIGAVVSLGLVGFLDDFIKIRHQRSL